MAKKKQSGTNLRLAGLFLLLVLGLIIVSAIFKFIFLLNQSKFEGSHRIVVAFVDKNNNARVVSFSPRSKSIYILKVDSKIRPEDLQRFLEVPITGYVYTGSRDINQNNVSSILFKSAFSLGGTLKNLTVIDAFRLFLFSNSVSQSSVYQKELLPNLQAEQKSTILTLSFTDPEIYQENLSIQVVNATDVYGLGSRLADLITNIGGNVVLVSTADNQSNISKITYYKNISYTAKTLSRILGFPLEKTDNRGVADVIITIGKNKLGDLNF